MTTRRILLLLAALLVVFIVLGTGAVGAVIWLASRAQTNHGQLLILDTARLSLLPSRGAARVLSEDTTSNGFLYPTPSPDGSHVAYVTSGADGTHVFALSLAKNERTELWSAPQPSQLVYMSWSPDSRYLSFITPSGLAGLGVFIVPSDGSAKAQLISGAQSEAYFAWTPDSHSLLVHLDGSVFNRGQVAAFAVSGQQPQVVSKNPGLFQAPAWSADGSHVFYVAQPQVTSAQPTLDDIESVLIRAAPDGSGVTELAHEKSAAIFFSRAPNSDQVAYTIFSLAQKSFGALTVVDGRTGAARVVSRPDEHVVAFFWSPDGERIAYLTRADGSDAAAEHTWHLVSPTGGDVRDLARFMPSQSFAGFVSFFDAYAHTCTLWSADSRLLTYATTDGVYTLDARSGATERVADGVLGMWVPPTTP